MNSNDNSEVVVCPFCGAAEIQCEGDGRAELAWMCCQKCFARGPTVFTRRGCESKSARARWSRRVTTAEDRTLLRATEFCEVTINAINRGSATLQGDVLDAFMALCTQCGISTLRINY